MLRCCDHIQNGKKTERCNEQQPKEQYKKLMIDNCKYCGAAHGQGQCLTFRKTCSTCRKQNHFRVVCQSCMGCTQVWPTPQQPRHMHEMHEEEEATMPI